MPKKKSTPTKKETGYTVSLTLGNDVYSVSTETLEQAFGLIRPPKVTSKGVLSIKSDKGQAETLMFPSQIKRILYGSESVKKIFGKKISLSLKHV